MKRKNRKHDAKEVLLVASGDLRLAANQQCWPAQAAMERALEATTSSLGYSISRAHKYDKKKQHGFIGSQREGMDIFAKIDKNKPLIVAESVWQYSHHILHGLISHNGPILTLANWSGQWPGLVGMLNLNGSLTKTGVRYSSLWSEDFSDPEFARKLKSWLDSGVIRQNIRHVQSLKKIKIPKKAETTAENLAEELLNRKAIMGVFDEGCMGMFNAIIPDALLFSTGVYKERLSQSALYYEMTQTPEREAKDVFTWLKNKGMRFELGKREETELTENQVLEQCKMYIAAARIGDAFGCDAIGIQYQQGLKDICPASDLAEGLLNNGVRPPVRNAEGKIIRRGKPFTHFNEVDECAGLDGILTQRVHEALQQPPENTLHDLRWGELYPNGSNEEYVWVFLISGAAPPAHHIGGYRGTVGQRQPPMYFGLGGSTVKGIAKPGEIIWSRIFVENNKLNMDIGRAKVVQLPPAETQRRWNLTTPCWPIMHAVLYGVTRDQMMARHKANHIQVAYAKDAAAADLCLYTKAALAQNLGICVSTCGTRKNGKPF